MKSGIMKTMETHMVRISRLSDHERSERAKSIMWQAGMSGALIAVAGIVVMFNYPEFNPENGAKLLNSIGAYVFFAGSIIGVAGQLIAMLVAPNGD